MRDIAFTTFLCLAVAGCSDADADKIRLVGDKTYERAALVAQQTWEELGRTLLDQQPKQPEHDLLSKVQLRIQWERELDTLPIVASLQGDTVTLTGIVKTKEQKERALKLAEGTLGIAKVTDELQLAEAGKAEPGKKE